LAQQGGGGSHHGVTGWGPGDCSPLLDRAGPGNRTRIFPQDGGVPGKDTRRTRSPGRGRRRLQTIGTLDPRPGSAQGR
jgi:hypothetical protein